VSKPVAAGHEVVGMTSRTENIPRIEAAGARAVAVGIFDRDGVMRAGRSPARSRDPSAHDA